jgi:hypothetical protein
MLLSPGELARLKDTYGVTHVFLSSYERTEGAREDTFLREYPLLYHEGDVSIYDAAPEE